MPVDVIIAFKSVGKLELPLDSSWDYEIMENWKLVRVKYKPSHLLLVGGFIRAS